MKKFLKSKIDNEETSNASPRSSSSSPNPTSPTPLIEDKEKKDKDKVKPEDQIGKVRPIPIQPPLPLDPPPISPPVRIKKEIEEVEKNYADESNIENSLQLLKQEIKTNLMENTKKKKPICRDFLRGTCSRNGSCKYLHEYDITQLVGVYTFCRNYQNSKCTYPNCKYLHASVFEEQKFYRTGILPAHAMSHKKVTMLPHPKDPPKLSTMPAVFSNPPLVLLNGTDKIGPIIPAINVDVSLLDISVASPPIVAHSPRDYGPVELAKTCSRCELLEFSLQYNKDMVDKMIKTIEEDKNIMTHLTHKSQKLYTILLGFLKSTVKTPMLSNITNYDHNSDNELHLWERLSKYFGAQT